MSKTITIPASTLKEIASGIENIPTMYYHPFIPIRWLFWSRLATITRRMSKHNFEDSIICDFGGGGGVFFPTLSKIFKKTVCVDLFVSEAEKIVELYNLKNIEIVQGDALKIDFDENYFDVAVAADVIEHFKELEPPIKRIYNWLKPGGKFYVSGPSENWLYLLGRKVFGITKPADHYHTVAQIEQKMKDIGFKISKKIFLPWHTSFPLFEYFSVFTIIEAEKSK